jgi:hypothetical protein
MIYYYRRHPYCHGHLEIRVYMDSKSACWLIVRKMGRMKGINHCWHDDDNQDVPSIMTGPRYLFRREIMLLCFDGLLLVV